MSANYSIYLYCVQNPVPITVPKVFHLYPHYRQELCCQDWNSGSLIIFDYPTKLQSNKEDAAVA